MTPRLLARRDLLGAQRLFFEPRSGRHGPTLLSLVDSARPRRLDPIGIAAAWSLATAPERTCLDAIRAVPPGCALERCDEGLRVVPMSSPSPSPSPSPSRPDLASALVAAAARALAGSRAPVVALGGGIDAPLAVLAARRSGVVVEHGVHLALPTTSYDESLAARETADALGLDLHELRITIDELAAELPRAVRIAETPLYNLHPVSRALVARAVRAMGHDALLTGDGADQASRGATETADYVPVVAALTRGAELALASPFLDEAVVTLLVASRDPEKRALRELARAWGLPSSIADRPKIPCSAPPLPRAAFPTAARLADLVRLARGLDHPLAWSDDDRLNVGIASLAAFASTFEVS